MSGWYVYLIRCRDGSLYTGISTDPERRLGEHLSGGTRGARYLRGKGPLHLVFQYPLPDRASASRYEYRLKQLPRSGKEKLIEGDLDPQELLTTPLAGG